MVKKTIKGFHDGSIILKTSNNVYTVAEHALVTSDYVDSGGPYGTLMEDMLAMPAPKNNTFIVNGEIVASGAGVLLQGVGDVATIGVTGEIHGMFGVYAAGTGNRVTNNGLIQSAVGYGIYGVEDNLNIRNNGEIYGLAGIAVSANHAAIVNSAKGEIHGIMYGIYLDSDTGDKSSITNHGSVTATTGTYYGLAGGDGNDTIVNDGSVFGGVDMGEGNDKLDDTGGKITGSIIGGKGNDVLTTDHAGDVLSENTGEGMDTVRSSVSYTLSQNVEKLILLGKGNINGTGVDSSAETLVGNSGNNTLRGLGGADDLSGGKGNDILVGGADADVFHFSTGFGKDTISDFTQTEDKIDLSGWGTMTSLAEVKDHAVDKGADLLITLGTDSLLIKNIHEANLTDTDFAYALV